MSRRRSSALALLLTLLAPAGALALGDFWDYYDKAQGLARKGDWESALNEYMNAVVLDKKDRNAARTYGMNFIDYYPNREAGIAYYQLGDNKKAKEFLDRSQASNPSERAKTYLLKISKGEAPQAGAEAGNQDTNSLARIGQERHAKEQAVKLASDARAALDVGNAQRALDLARKAKALDPSNGTAMTLEARAERELQTAREKDLDLRLDKGEIKAGDRQGELRKELEARAEKRMDAGRRLLDEKNYLDASVEFEGVPKGSSLYKEAQSQMALARDKAKEAEAALETGAVPSQPKIKARVAVADFEPVGVDQNTAKAVSENLRTSMIESRRYYVLERALLNKVLEQQKLQLAGITDPDQAVQIGKLMAVRFLALGSLTKLGSTLTINFRFIDVETGEAVVARNVRAASEDDLPGRIDELVQDVQKFQL